MIYQVVGNPANKILQSIPFQSGVYDIRFLRVECLTDDFTAPFYITSDRIPFQGSKNYRDALTVQRCSSGLFLTGDQWATTRSYVIYDAQDYPLIFKNVFLDGYIDFSFFNMGMGGGGALYQSPPQVAGQRPLSLGQTTPSVPRIIFTLDIIPSKK